MYRDFVDIKHPGVHHCYALGLWLFSSLADPEFAVHALELAVWLVLGLFVQYTQKSRLTFPVLAALAPIALGAPITVRLIRAGSLRLRLCPGRLSALACGWLAEVAVEPAAFSLYPYLPAWCYRRWWFFMGT